MNLADVFTVLFIVLGFLVVFLGYWLAAAGLFPTFIEGCSEKLGRSPLLTVAIGAAIMIPQVAFGFWLSSKASTGPGKIIGLVIVGVALLVALVGSAGLALRIGSGLKSSRDEHEPWRRVLRGGIVLGLTFVLPFLGTFVIMPLAFLAGFGAFVLTPFRRRELAASGRVPSSTPSLGTSFAGSSATPTAEMPISIPGVPDAAVSPLPSAMP